MNLKLKQKTLSKIEGFGLILILIAFFFQLAQEKFQSDVTEMEYYYLNQKLDSMWRVIEKDYIDNHPQNGISMSINFESYAKNWKIYSEQLKDLKPFNEDANLFSSLSIWTFIIGTIMVIIPKFIPEK